MSHFNIEQFPGRFVYTNDDGRKILLKPGMRNPPDPIHPPKHMDDDSDFESEDLLTSPKEFARRWQRARHNYGENSWREAYLRWWGPFGHGRRHIHEYECQAFVKNGKDQPAHPYPRTPTSEQLEEEMKSRHWTGDPNKLYQGISKAEDYEGWLVHFCGDVDSTFGNLIPPGYSSIDEYLEDLHRVEKSNRACIEDYDYQSD